MKASQDDDERPRAPVDLRSIDDLSHGELVALVNHLQQHELLGSLAAALRVRELRGPARVLTRCRGPLH